MTNLKKGLAVAAVAATILTGCSSTSDSNTNSADSPSLSADSETQEYESARNFDITDKQVEELYASMVRSEWPADFGTLSDEDIIDTGKTACQALDGASFYELVEAGVDAGYDLEVISGYIGASIAAFCPEHEDKMN